MLDSDLIIFFVLFICAFIQSIFGIGLLAFGTPSLMLLGLNFELTLSLLLPCSLSVSFLQVMASRDIIDRYQIFKFIVCATPMLTVGLLTATHVSVKDFVAFCVGIILILTAILRLKRGARKSLQKFIDRFERSSIVIIGFVHGISNLGGGLLTVFSNLKYVKPESQLAFIAHIYLMFSIVQISVLWLSDKLYVDSLEIFRISLCVATFFGVRVLFLEFSPNKIHQQMLTVLLLSYGLLILIA